MPKQSPATARDRVAAAAADFGGAADAVDTAASGVLGINRTDFRILSALMLRGPLSARALGEVVTLSPAATTEAVQRLVRARRLTREIDPVDRRRALITVDPGTVAQIAAMYDGVRAAGMDLIARYTDDELAVIVDFLDRGRQMQLQQAKRISREHANHASVNGATLPGY